MSVTYQKFSKRQLLAMNWWNQPEFRDRDGILCDGAVRSGKTMALCCGFFLWSMASFDGAVFALCGKTVSSLRRNVILQLGDWLGDLFSVTEHRQDNRLTVRLGSRVNTYYLFGGQDESSYMTIQGITLAGVLLDEVVLMPRSFVEQAAARCSVIGSKLWFSCNPEGPEHWFFKEWVEKAAEKNLLRLHFTMDDNPGLSPEVRSRYDRLYTGVFYRRYVLGQWCKAEGLVYEFDPQKHIVTGDFVEKCRQVQRNAQNGRKMSTRWYISVDYGTYNAFSAGLWLVTEERKAQNDPSSVCFADTFPQGKALRTVGDAGPYKGAVAVRVREFYHSGRDTGKLLTDEEYHRALVELAGDADVEFVVIDPSAASMIATLRKVGRFRVRRAKNAVLPGIAAVSTLLRQGRLKICDGCRDAIREFSLYSWEDDPGKDAPKKENDHAMDDIRYFVITVMGR